MESGLFYKTQWRSTELETKGKCNPRSVTWTKNWIRLRESERACPAPASLGLHLLGSIPITAKQKQTNTNYKKETRPNLTPTKSNFVKYKIIPGEHNKLQLVHQYHDLLHTVRSPFQWTPTLTSVDPNSPSSCCLAETPPVPSLTLGTSPLLWAS